MKSKKNLTILGSTGSIGTQTLEVVENLKDKYKIYAIAARGTNLDIIKYQIEKFKPHIVALSDEKAASKLKSSIDSSSTKIYSGLEGIIEVATDPIVDVVVAAISGVSGLLPTYNAIKAGKDVALANKETLVSAGHLVMESVKEGNIKLLPVDSEHSAIFQCLETENKSAVKSIILTASGGAFRDLNSKELKKVTPSQALKHPNWSMGKKITIDSATLMNKGLEVIEAHWLFNIDYNNIEVVIHPESIIHSMVRYNDGSIIAQLGVPDMKIAIQYALTWPKRLNGDIEQLDLVKIGQLNFMEPRWNDFPCLQLAYEAGKMGGNYPAVLNAANEVAVECFLEEKISFHQIPKLISKALERCKFITKPTLEEVITTDKTAREDVKQILSSGKVSI